MAKPAVVHRAAGLISAQQRVDAEANRVVNLAGAASQQVQFGVERSVAVAAGRHDVAAPATVDRVKPAFAEQRVVMPLAQQGVVVVAAQQQVRTQSATQTISSVTAAE